MNELNEEQREAVESEHKNSLVIAGAGSGKTKVLTHRATHLVENKEIPEYKIMATTFTNKAANEMKERIKDMTGRNKCDIMMGTFHSICLRLLKKYAKEEVVKPNFTIADEKKKQSILKKIIKEMSLEDDLNYKLAGSYISNYKTKLLEPDDAETRAENNYEREKIIPIYREYQSQLRNSGNVDFDDLIMLTVKMLRRDEEARNRITSLYDHVLIDEYQDTNEAQLALLQIMSQGADMFAVGDDSQSIYAFRGAKIDNMLEFEQHFPEAKVFMLERNYRSTENILEAANKVIENNSSQREKKLWTEKGQGSKIPVNVHDDPGCEAEHIAERIRSLVLSREYDYGDIAILYRTNAQSRPIEQEMMARATPYTVVSGTKFFERMEIRDIMAYLYLIENANDTMSMERIINVPKRGIGKTTVNKLLVQAQDKEFSMYELCKRGEYELSSRASSKVDSFITLIDDLKREAADMSVDELIRLVINTTGYEQYIKRQQGDDGRMENVEELIAMSRQYDSLYEFLNDVSLMTDQDSIEDNNSVKLMTVHAAKGLEFPVVFIVGAEEGMFPHGNSLNSDEDIEEERRLFHVAMTRAEDKLFISYCTARQMGWGLVQTEPSRFINEIPNHLKKGATEWNQF